MELIFMAFPGFISSSILEKLEKKSFLPLSYFKYVCIFDIFINICSIFIYAYVYRGSNSIYEHFYSNAFLLHYALTNIVLSLIIPIGYRCIRPWFKIDIEDQCSKAPKEKQDGAKEK